MMIRRRFFAVFALLLALMLPALGAMSDKEFTGLCMFGTAEQVADAIKGGANVNAKLKDGPVKGSTALMAAVANNKSPEVIDALINAGADVNRTALDIARAKNNTAAVKVLEGTLVRRAAKQGHKPARNELAKRGIYD